MFNDIMIFELQIFELNDGYAFVIAQYNDFNGFSLFTVRPIATML
jgi:hypothetical protein